ncbi:FxsA family protein [Nocardioides caeni]|uniref:FxsA family protein n=1 Tax=Nocardioides caeni TaxID=574700 RepID=A0A4V4HJ77_9ACTN|nr:FxsA family protein [Nocardioides caeni]
MTAAVLLAFLLVPIAEIYVLIQIGQVIGPWWTILLLVVDSILGAWLIKREGRKAWAALRERVETGALPARELADGALIVLGGALMLSPGFVTDVVGILLILPVTRPLFRGLITSYAVRRVATPARRNAPRPGPEVVRGEVIDDGE